MDLSTQFQGLSHYNRDMNARLLEACQPLDHAALAKDRGAFFGSILGTLNHLLVADIMWMRRFMALSSPATQHLHTAQQPPEPTALDDILAPDLAMLWPWRQRLDEDIVKFCQALTQDDFAATLHYRNRRGDPHSKAFGAVLLHFFNHQTHHRGQITTLLSQLGVDVGITDYLLWIPETDQP